MRTTVDRQVAVVKEAIETLAGEAAHFSSADDGEGQTLDSITEVEREALAALEKLSRRLAREQARKRNAQNEMERTLERVGELQLRVDRLESALERVASPRRPDGSYNLGREACEQIARKALERRL